MKILLILAVSSAFLCQCEPSQPNPSDLVEVEIIQVCPAEGNGWNDRPSYTMVKYPDGRLRSHGGILGKVGDKFKTYKKLNDGGFE